MPTGTKYGYGRVSTKKQHEDRQLIALQECNIPPRNIFIDKQSGKDFERRQYVRLVQRLKQGDTVFIKSIDRLGRNYEEIQNQWRLITKDVGADIVIIDMPLLDTRQKEKDLTGTFIADLVLQILSYVAETERAYNHQRQAEGIAVARAKGVKFGRPPLKRPEQFAVLREAWLQKKISARAAALKLGVTHRTFTLWASEQSAMITG
jgi:DNA invertase Pin-like site-specific DNA recombinase